MNLLGTPLICHVLLLELSDGLALVDTGLGLLDVANPARALSLYRHIVKPAARETETACRQIQQLGFDPHDVRHIVLTHLDGDHAGGLADFPQATVHVSADEAYAAMSRPSLWEKLRYAPAQWEHQPQIVAHSSGTTTWRGFDGACQLTDIGADIWLIPLAGHSRGHAAVAVADESGWILHAGDAFYHHGTLDGLSKASLPLRAQEAAFAYDRQLLKENQNQLRKLAEQHDPTLRIINAHDPVFLNPDRALQVCS